MGMTAGSKVLNHIVEHNAKLIMKEIIASS